MQSWVEDQLKDVFSADSEQVLFDRVAKIALAMGFEYCAYGIQLPMPILKPKIILFSNYPENWKVPYHESQLLNPNIQHCLKSSLPVAWTEQFFAETPAFWEELRSYGIRYGWTHSSRDARGTIGGLALACCVEQVTERELYTNQAKMAWLTHYAHAAMAKIMIPKYAPESLITITAREREVLLWTAEGKTAYEIGRILDVTPRTINFHLIMFLLQPFSAPR